MNGKGRKEEKRLKVRVNGGQTFVMGSLGDGAAALYEESCRMETWKLVSCGSLVAVDIGDPV